MRLLAPTAALLALLGGPGPASAQDRPPLSRDDELLGGDEPPSGDDASTLEPEGNKVTVGGLLYLRSQLRLSEGQSADEAKLSLPSIAEVYVDGQPNERVRGMLRGRLLHDPSYDPESDSSSSDAGATRRNPDVLLDQLWIRFDIARTLFVTAGRQHNRWGVGRLWQPTNFLQPVRLAPTAIYDERTGVTALKLHLPWESTGANFYAIAQLEGADEPIDKLDRVLGATRAEFLIGSMEVGVDALFRRGQKPRVGLDASMGLGWFDLYLDAGFRAASEQWVYRPLAEPGPTLAEQFAASHPDGRFGLTTEAVAGGSVEIPYSDEDVVVLAGEYFHRSAGYPDARAYPWLTLGPTIAPGTFVGEGFVPFYLGRHYAAVFASLPSPGSWDDVFFTVTNLCNLSDRSCMSRLDTSLMFLTDLRLELFAEYYYGETGGELQLDFTIPARCASGATPCEPGEVIPASRVRAPLASFGMNLKVEF